MNHRGRATSKKLKTDELGINESISWTHRTLKIGKNQNLSPHQSRITFPSLPWYTLYVALKFLFLIIEGAAVVYSWVWNKTYNDRESYDRGRIRDHSDGGM